MGRLACGALLLATTLVVSPSAQSSGGRYQESIAGTLVTFEMVRVPAGPGMPEFYMSRTEVTWDLFDVYMLRLDSSKPHADADAIARPSEPYGAPDYGWGHAGFPAMSIASGSAVAFCQWLSAKTGKTYRLPTDAEWTHAATLASRREGGAKVSIDEVSWHGGNASARTHPVGTRPPDALGLFDLFGNVAEWVSTGADAYTTRGGSYRELASALGPTSRADQDPSWNERDPQLPKSRWWLSDGPFVGFRVLSPVK